MFLSCSRVQYFVNLFIEKENAETSMAHKLWAFNVEHTIGQYIKPVTIQNWHKIQLFCIEHTALEECCFEAFYYFR